MEFAKLASVEKQTFWVRLDGEDLTAMKVMREWPDQPATTYAAILKAALRYYYENHYLKTLTP